MSRTNPRLLSARALLVLSGCVVLSWSAGCAPARRPLTYDLLFGPQHVDFSGNYARGLEWAPDSRHYLERRDDVLHAVDAETGAATPEHSPEVLAAALRALLPELDEPTAASLAKSPRLFDARRERALLVHAQRLYLYEFAGMELRCLTPEPAERRELAFSPDGTRLAWVQGQDLYALDVTATGGEPVRLTTDGSETLLNGLLDWVYQEEVFGRGNWRGFWWSKDSQHLAYLQLDTQNVPVYPLVDYLAGHPRAESLRYPKAGDPNPVPRLGIVGAAGPADTCWVHLDDYAGTDILIVGVAWSPAGELVFAVQDREGTWLDLDAADATTGACRRIFRETSPAWVDYEAAPHWLADGSFLWSSAADGWQHIYRYAADGTLLKRLTSGAWEARSICGVDEAGGWVYFTGTRDSSIETHVYRVPLVGGDVARITAPGFSHQATFSPNCRLFIDTYSSATAPPRVNLCRADGTLVRVLSANPVPALTECALQRPEFVRVPTPRGHELNAMILRPPQRRPGQRFPVMVFTYAGPHGPVVHNQWDSYYFAFQQYLASRGIIVWNCDPHSASGEGAISAWQCYQNLGASELTDLETSLHWLARHEHADLDRVGIIGHSYGGFMASYALTHSDAFKIGIAAAPVTDWHNYDSIYTERYMRTPEHNPEGYARSSVVAAAGGLSGRLLIVHGLGDDNVHAQNTFQLIDKLLQEGRMFDLMVYPAANHGLRRYQMHWQALQRDFIERAL